MSSNDNCICCGIPVRARQEGLQCETCLRWQHRTCQTGISQRVYREAVKSGQAIDWHCSLCFKVPQLNAEPDFESTRLDDSESARLQEHSETTSVTRASEVLIPDCEESSVEEPDIVDCSIDDCPPTTGQVDGGLQNYRVQATGSSSYFNTPDIINSLL